MRQWTIIADAALVGIFVHNHEYAWAAARLTSSICTRIARLK